MQVDLRNRLSAVALLVSLAACAGDATAPLPAPSKAIKVSLLGVPDTVFAGDVLPFGVRVQDGDGEDVLGRAVTLESDNHAVAVIDPSGRIRAIATGNAVISAKVDGVAAAKWIFVKAQTASFPLRDYNGARLPFLVAADSVSWDGAGEYHEVYVESGRLQLSGGATPRYITEVYHAEYAVSVGAAGRKTMSLRAAWTERDRGLVAYDARGDLAMTSEIVWPLSHAASVASQGLTMRYRIPGDDTVLSLMFRREPQ